MKRDFDGVSVHQPARLDWTASFFEHLKGRNERRALSWASLDTLSMVSVLTLTWLQDEQSVTIEYFSSCRTSTMTTFLVPGAPYITLSYNNSTPVFSTLDAEILSVNGDRLVAGRSICSASPVVPTLVQKLIARLFAKFKIPNSE